MLKTRVEAFLEMPEGEGVHKVMITCGIDAGPECLKVALRESVLPTAKAGLDDALARAAILKKSIDYITVTGS